MSWTHVYDDVPTRIEGTVRIDPENIPERYQQLPKDKVVLAYCT